ncbi:hypothetical protein DFH27DRAFT_313885 [Peziza echinospora]|nr:hypothetical protein DFH27DRAFT_313885 [Peziza echinospora]
MMPPTPRTMRRSCQFCRSRKIKCSGQDKCDVCRERNNDCVYGQEASKGRPRRKPGIDSTSLSPNPQNSPHNLLDIGDISIALLPPNFNADFTSELASDMSSMLTPGGGSEEFDYRTPSQSPMPAQGMVEHNLALELESIFKQNFSPLTDERHQPSTYQEAIYRFNRQRQLDSDQLHTCMKTSDDALSLHPSGFRSAVRSYDEILSVLTHQLVEIIVTKYGALGCHYLADISGNPYYLEALACDDTTAIFPVRLTEVETPFKDYDTNRTLQLIESWFSVHPLANILSKTIFLRQYKSGTHDHIILSLIMSDALYIGGDKNSIPQAEVFFDYAMNLLQTQKACSINVVQAQALALLGWHELCLGKARRATCFLTYGCQIVMNLINQEAGAPTTGLSRINGIDVGEVESELMHNIYWFVFSITLWCFMQFDEPIDDLLPKVLSMNFPPSDQSRSVAHKLDLVSGNIGTFQRQAQMMRELWTLSQISSTIGNVYSLFPKYKQDIKQPPTLSSWQSTSLHNLVPPSHPCRDILTLSSGIRRNLRDSTSDLTPQRVTSSLCRVTLMGAYNAVILHLIFPRICCVADSLSVQDEHCEVVLTSDILDTFVKSAHELIEVSGWLGHNEFVSGSEGLFRSTELFTHPSFSTASNMFVLGLDACARSLDMLSRNLNQMAQDGDVSLLERQRELAEIANKLLLTARLERLAAARRIRAVKKDIKAICRRLLQSENKPDEHTPTVDQTSVSIRPCRDAGGGGRGEHAIFKSPEANLFQLSEFLDHRGTPQENIQQIASGPRSLSTMDFMTEPSNQIDSADHLDANFLNELGVFGSGSANLLALNSNSTPMQSSRYLQLGNPQQGISVQQDFRQSGDPASHRSQLRQGAAVEQVHSDCIDRFPTISYPQDMDFWDIGDYPS